MNRRRRGGAVVAWLLRVLVVGAVLAVWFWGPFVSTETETASISRFDAAMDLSRTGELRSLETIEVQMPGGKRGIFRTFDTADPRRANVEHPVDIDWVERDGDPEPWVEVPSAEGTTSIRIGDEDVYLDPGSHTYLIASSTSEVFEPGDDGETLWWWDVVGAGWQMRMDEASVRVQLPARPLRAECVQGEDTPCTASVEGTSLQVSTGPLEPFTPVTVRVAFPEDAVGPTVAGGPDWATVVPTVVAVLVAALAAWWCWRRTREREPGFPVLFEPPFLIPPALGVKVLDETDSDEDLQATLFDLAERGVLRLQGDDDTWRIEVVQQLDAEQLHPLETALLSGLGLRGEGDTFLVTSSESSGRKVSAARSSMRTEVADAARAHLDTSGVGTAAVLLGWAALIATVVIVGVHFFGDTGWVSWPLLAGAATFSFGVMGLLFDPGVRTTRSAEGRDLWSRTGGFARFLTTDSSEARFDASAHLDWYPRYLAWAVALGVADQWAARYREQGVEVPAVPWLLWTGTGQQFSTDSMNRSFNSAIAGASAAYAASQASSGGGGGFSGGSGGGGGGGGSW